MTVPPVRHGDVLQHGLAAIAEARGLDGDDIEHAAQLVQHQGGQRLAVHVLGDDHNFALAELDQLLQDRDDVGRGRNLLVGDQHVRVAELGFHGLGAGDEVRADVAAIEFHTFDVLGLELQTLRLFDGDDAVFADLLHDLGDQCADLRILGRNRGHGGDLFLGRDGDGLRLDVGGEGGDTLLDAALQQHGVGAGGHVLEAFVDDGLGQHGRGGGAVTGDVVGLGRGFLQKLRAHVLPRILELDFLGDGHAIVRDGGGAPFFVQRHVAALGAESGLNGFRQGVNADLEAATRFIGENQLLSHG